MDIGDAMWMLRPLIPRMQVLEENEYRRRFLLYRIARIGAAVGHYCIHLQEIQVLSDGQDGGPNGCAK